MNKPRLFASPNMIITFSNVIFFIVVQTFFFKYIASKQFNVVLSDKVGILNEYLKYDPEMTESIKQFTTSEEANEIKSKAKIQEKEREKLNKQRIKLWVGVPLVIATIM